MKATSAYLNLPPRTETQVKCQTLPARFKGWHSFEVRKVYYGDEHTGSYLLEDEQGPPKSEPDAFGVYGVPPDEDLQYHVSDCKTLADALTLKLTLQYPLMLPYQIAAYMRWQEAPKDTPVLIVNPRTMYGKAITMKAESIVWGDPVYRPDK